MKTATLSLVLLLNLVAVFAALPSYLTKCKKDDPEFDACFLKSAQAGLIFILKGDEALGIPSYLPLKYHSKKHLGNEDIKFDVTNFQVINTNSSRVTDAKWDIEGRKISITFQFDNIMWDFDLDIAGKFNNKDLDGDGSGHATQTFLNGWYSIEIEYDAVEANGVLYPKVKQGKVDYQAKTILYNFSGIDEAANAYLNKHQTQFDKALHAEICDFVYENIKLRFDAIFKVTPMDDLFL